MSTIHEHQAQTTIPEHAPVPEGIGRNEQMIGLTTRLLLGGENINPAKQIDAVTPSSLQLRENTLTLISKASSHNREAFWAGRAETTFDARITAWKNETKTSLTSLATTLSQDTEKQIRWKNVLSRTGIPALENITDENMQAFYDKYFSGTKKESDLEAFVEDIAGKYVTNDQPVDYESFYKDMDAISWLGNIFGEKIAKTIPSLIEARLTHGDAAKRAEIATKAVQEENGIKRINRLTEGENNEKELLTYIWQHGRDLTAIPSLQPDRTAPTETPGAQQREQIPTTVIEEVTPDTAHIRQITEQEATAPPEKDYDTADRLIDYVTGKAKNEQVDLQNEYTQFLTRIEQGLEADTVISPHQPHLALSPVARGMLDRFATDSNNRDRELVFVVMGVPVRKNGKTVLAGAYIIPASDYTALQRTKCAPHAGTFEHNAEAVARNTNLKNIFRQRARYNEGEIMAVLHTHQESLGTAWKITPSEQDYTTAGVNAAERPYFPWGVVTKTGDRIGTRLILSKHDRSTNQTDHQDLPLFRV